MTGWRPQSSEVEELDSNFINLFRRNCRAFARQPSGHVVHRLVFWHRGKCAFWRRQGRKENVGFCWKRGDIFHPTRYQKKTKIMWSVTDTKKSKDLLGCETQPVANVRYLLLFFRQLSSRTTPFLQLIVSEIAVLWRIRCLSLLCFVFRAACGHFVPRACVEIYFEEEEAGRNGLTYLNRVRMIFTEAISRLESGEISNLLCFIWYGFFSVKMLFVCPVEFFA